MRRRPLVRIAGQDVQLPEGDSIDPGLVLLRTEVATATATEQTIFEVEYHVGMIAVTLDGALLPPVDYTAEDGEHIVLGSGDGVAVGSMLTVLIFAPFAVADALPIGGTAVNSARLGGELPASYVRNPMTTAGDMVVGGEGGAPVRLARGADGTIPKWVAGVLTWVAHGLNILLQGYSETLDSTSATAINVLQSNVFRRVLSAPTTYTFTGAAAARCCSFTLYLEGGATYLPTFPESVKWIGGAPTLTAKDRLVFETIDNGATWLGTYAGSYA
ncbi:hypothetical protein [Aquipseudomonas campi]